MTDLRTHRKDQGGLTNGTLGFVYSMLGTITLATLAQILVPSWPGLIPATHHNPYRLFLIGCLVAEVSFVYVMIRLGGTDTQSEHRGWYVRFRSTIADNGIGSFYARGVRWALARIDQFFGDADKGGEGLWPRAFGLHHPAPLWTAQSYDRCLILALTYPLLVIFLGWVASGEALAIEDALLMRDASVPERGIALAATIAFSYLFTVGYDKLEPSRSYYLVPAILLIAVPFFCGAGFTSPLFGAALACSKNLQKFHGSASVVALVVAITLAVAPVAPLLASIILCIGILFAQVARRYPLGPVLGYISLGWLISIFDLAGKPLMGSSENVLTLLYFVGILTVINAPFDWLALGISRGLLRRGLQQGGLVPIWLGLLDIAVSLVLMTMLAIAVLWSAEIFDYMTLRGGNPPVLDPEAMLAELREHATLGNTHYWWLYAMMFSTQIPALVNLLFGLFCLLRGVTGLNAWMLARLPEEGGIGVWQRMSVSSAWSAQMGVAVATGLLSVYWFFAVLIPALDPAFGSRLIDWLDALRFLPIRPPGTLVG